MIKVVESGQTQFWSSLQLIGTNKEREVFTYKYTILDIFYDCDHSLKYDMLKELMLDKEDNVMGYAFSHLS